jgi:hypothetical protein
VKCKAADDRNAFACAGRCGFMGFRNAVNENKMKESGLSKGVKQLFQRFLLLDEKYSKIEKPPFDDHAAMPTRDTNFPWKNQVCLGVK